ncbi:MAG: hypothetical protein FWE35_16735 [Streptosporangiales bacterium]|nr:hypothetical protein [Streptosporangiales bacterium]
MESGEGEPQRKRVSERTKRQLFADGAITFVGAGGAVTIFASASSVYAWGCGVAFVVFFLCLLAWQYGLIGKERHWWRWSLAGTTAVSGVAIVALPLIPMVLPKPNAYPQTATVKDCRASGPLGRNKPGRLPPGISASTILAMPVYTCSVKSSVPGLVPVYLAPEARGETGKMIGNDHQWFLCRVPGRDASAWYYTQGSFSGESAYQSENAWGVVASSSRPDPEIPGCPPVIRQLIASGPS